MNNQDIYCDLNQNWRAVAPEVKALGDLHLPGANEMTLSNGVRLKWYDGGTQAVNQFSMAFTGGAAEGGIPVARLCGLMLSEGTVTKSGAEISEDLDFRGAHFLAREQVHYSLVKVASLNSMSTGLLPIVREMICQPAFDQNAFNVVRERYVKSLILNKTYVQYVADQKLSEVMMGKENSWSIQEEPEDAMKVTVDDLIKFHKEVYVADGCHVFLSGHITPQLLDEISSMLMSLPISDKAMPLKRFTMNPEPPGSFFIEKNDALQNAIAIGFPAPERSHPDFIPLRFAVMALGGYFGSRLMRNIREDKGYTYGISAYLKGMLDGSYVGISTQTDPKNVDAVLREIRKELELLASEPMDDEEMFRLRQYIGTVLMEVLESPFSIINYYQTELMVGMPKGYYDKQTEIARHLTPEMVMEMTRKYLQPDQMRIVIAGINQSL